MTKIKTNILTITSFLAVFVLFLSLSFILFSSFYKNEIESFILQKNHILVTHNQDSSIVKTLMQVEGINPSSITSLSKTHIKQKSNINQFIDTSIISPMYQLDLNNFKSIHVINKIQTSIENIQGVKRVYINKQIYRSLINNYQYFKWIIYFLFIMFCFLSYVIMYNNVKNAIINQRPLIKKLKIMGASNLFFKKPFYKHGLIILILIFIVICLIGGSLFYRFYSIDQVNSIFINRPILYTLLIDFALCLLLIWSSIYFSFKKHLITRNEDLF